MSKLVNGGSPVGPGFVVYERAPGKAGYDLEMALQSVGPGWKSLIECLFKHISFDIEHNATNRQAPEIHQVKEKFGTLTIYHTGEGYYDGFVDALEAVSAVTCETCGQPGKIRGKYWLSTCCTKCWYEQEIRQGRRYDLCPD